MSMNETPAADRVHIGFFGRRNAGKSSVVNAVTGQSLSVVSAVLGTTTDPVYKAMELLPLGPVMIIDTPGTDDEGELGSLRVKKTRQVLNKTDVAVLIVDARAGLTPHDGELIKAFNEKGIEYIVAYNKSDLVTARPDPGPRGIYVSALTGEGITALKEKIAALSQKTSDATPLVSDLIAPGDLVVLVTPIDRGAPKGRLILPQQQTIRDILDRHAFAVVAQETELGPALSSLSKKPALVITDSQVFDKAAAATPDDVPLTSFSILFARQKGLLDSAVAGVAALSRLKEGDRVLIAEGCTHHRQCDDIGTVKLPRLIEKYTGKVLRYEFSSGGGFPDDLTPYSLIIHCGGCMLKGGEIKYRQKRAAEQGIPITNYGIAIAAMQGILRRSIEIFPHLLHKLDSM